MRLMRMDADREADAGPELQNALGLRGFLLVLRLEDDERALESRLLRACDDRLEVGAKVSSARWQWLSITVVVGQVRVVGHGSLVLRQVRRSNARKAASRSERRRFFVGSSAKVNSIELRTIRLSVR